MSINSIVALGVVVLMAVTPTAKIKRKDWNDFKSNSLLSLSVKENNREKKNIANNKRDGEIVPSTWNIGDNGKWVAYDSNSKLVKGLIFDKTRNCYFLMNLSNGDMVYENGIYIIKNKPVHLTFNNVRVGDYGCLDSGIEELKDILK
jgi:hypothetical protein